MARRAVKEIAEDIVDKEPVYMPKHEVQKIYLEIMQRIGELEKAAPKELRKEFYDIGIEMLKTKRKWIGIVDELHAEPF